MINMHDNSKDDKWENGELGASEEHVRKVSSEEEKAVDEALGLQIISIRLQKELITSLKETAREEGLGYQPLIRQILTRYIRDRTSNKGGHHRKLRAL